MATRKPQGITLSASKVREYAESIGIVRLMDLEYEYDGLYEGTDVYSTGACKKAWEGKRNLGKKYANQIAKLFGLSSYLMLLEDQGISSWEKLVTEDSFQSRFIKFELTSKAGSGMFDIPYETTPPDSIDQINTAEKFFLILSGKTSERFMAVLQSTTKAFQLAPLSADNFDNIIRTGKDELRYPSVDAISFAKEFGLGWRRLVVIRSSHIPLGTKSFEAGRPDISSETLDAFARRVIQSTNSFKVDTYEFNLVETETIRRKAS